MPGESQFSGLERAFVVAKSWENSTNFHKYHADGNILKVESLYDYYTNGDYELKERKWLDPMKKHTPSQETMRYIVIELQDATTEHISGDGKIRLFLDPAGHDIKVNYLDEHGNSKDILAPNLLKNNAEILKNLDLATNMSPEDVAKMITPKETADIVQAIDERGSVGMRSAVDAKERCDEHDKDKMDNDPRKVGAQEKEAQEQEKVKKENDEKEQPEDQLSEKEIDEKMKENKDIPQDQYSVVREMCVDNNLDPSKLKQIIKVNNPETVSNKIDDRKSAIRENGGPITMLRFRNDDVSRGGSDTVMLIQDDQILPHDERNDQTLTEAMDKHQGTNVNMRDFDDFREEEAKKQIELEKMRHMQEIDRLKTSLENGEIDDATHDEKVNQLTYEHQKNIISICDGLYPTNDEIKEEVDFSMVKSEEFAEDIKNISDDEMAKDSNSQEQSQDDAGERYLGDTASQRRGF